MTPREVRDEWVAALRSGDYKQGFRWLKQKSHDGNCYHCALGVLTEVLQGKGYLGNFRKVLDYDTLSKSHLINESGMLNRPVEMTNATRMETHMVSSLASMNDMAMIPFSKIADYLDDHPENVFLNWQGESHA